MAETQTRRDRLVTEERLHAISARTHDLVISREYASLPDYARELLGRDLPDVMQEVRDLWTAIDVVLDTGDELLTALRGNDIAACGAWMESLVDSHDVAIDKLQDAVCVPVSQEEVPA